MDTKHTFKELLYLCTGWAVEAKDDFNKMIEALVDDHKMTREEGKKVIDALLEKSDNLKTDWLHKKEEFIHRLVKKKMIVEEDVALFIEIILNRPNQAKKSLVNKYEGIIERIISRTNMAKNEVEGKMDGMVKEIEEVKNKFEAQAKALIKEMSQKAKYTRDKGEEWMAEPLAKLNISKEELNMKLDAIMHSWLDRMHIASKEELSGLTKRVNALEKAI